jgi:hypothetical protein
MESGDRVLSGADRMRERLLGCLGGSEKGVDGMAFRIYISREN